MGILFLGGNIQYFHEQFELKSCYFCNEFKKKLH